MTIVAREVILRSLPRVPGLEQLISEAPEILHQGQLDHARPRPQLADGERSDTLEVGQEFDQPRFIQPAVGMADQLDGHHPHAGLSPVCGSRHHGQRARIGAREIPSDVAQLRRDERKIIQQPVGRRHHELACAAVIGESAIRGAQHTDVVLKPRNDVRGASAWIGIHRQTGRERRRPLVQSVDVQQFRAKRTTS